MEVMCQQWSLSTIADLIKSADLGQHLMEITPGLPGFVFISFDGKKVSRTERPMYSDIYYIALC